jgi:uncharacterized protein YjiS (DUF1127 family)
MQFSRLVWGIIRPYLRLTDTRNTCNFHKKDKDMAAFDTTRTTYGSHGLIGRIGATLASVGGAIAAWNDIRATRNALSGLSDRELDDIGLVRGDIDLIAHGERHS